MKCFAHYRETRLRKTTAFWLAPEKPEQCATRALLRELRLRRLHFSFTLQLCNRYGSEQHIRGTSAVMRHRWAARFARFRTGVRSWATTG
jgi:hypothetical protein